MTNRSLAIQTLVGDMAHRKDTLYRALRAYTRDNDIDINERWRIFSTSGQGNTYGVGLGLVPPFLRPFERPNGSNHIVDLLKADCRRHISRNIHRGIPVSSIYNFLINYVGRQYPASQLASGVMTTFTADHLMEFKQFCLSGYTGKLEFLPE